VNGERRVRRPLACEIREQRGEAEAFDTRAPLNVISGAPGERTQRKRADDPHRSRKKGNAIKGEVGIAVVLRPKGKRSDSKHGKNF